jgi:hypothetical protein
MRELVVRFLTYFVEHSPYLLLACAFVGAFVVARSFIHKGHIITEQLTHQVHDGKAELRVWFAGIGELWRELTTWNAAAPGNSEGSAREGLLPTRHIVSAGVREGEAILPGTEDGIDVHGRVRSIDAYGTGEV